MKKVSRVILLVDDDEDHCFLIKESILEIGAKIDLRCIFNGEELLQYLHRRKEYADEKKFPWPDLILLDLEMPGMGGHEVLKEIKADNRLKIIPIIVMTQSDAESDIHQSYGFGANSYLVKPNSFDRLVDMFKLLTEYWLELVALPSFCSETRNSNFETNSNDQNTNYQNRNSYLF